MLGVLCVFITHQRRVSLSVFSLMLLLNALGEEDEVGSPPIPVLAFALVFACFSNDQDPMCTCRCRPFALAFFAWCPRDQGNVVAGFANTATVIAHGRC